MNRREFLRNTAAAGAAVVAAPLVALAARDPEMSVRFKQNMVFGSHDGKIRYEPITVEQLRQVTEALKAHAVQPVNGDYWAFIARA